MRAILTVCAVVLFCVGGLCFAGERTEQQTKAAKDFKFEGVSFSTSLEEFLKMCPDARPFDGGTNDKVGTRAFQAQSKSATCVVFFFFDGKLCEMRILYQQAELNKLGGLDVVLGKLVEKFGKAEADSAGVISRTPFKAYLKWRVTDAKKFVELNVEEKYIRVDVTDTDVQGKMQEKQKKAVDTGF